jgi:mannan endo-1,4-beta-mannosidase
MLTQRRRRAQHQLTRGRGSVSKRYAVTGVLAAVIVAVIAVAAVKEFGTAGVKHDEQPSRPHSGTSTAQGSVRLPAAPGSYLGIYVPGAPTSYAGLTSFTETTGVRPNLVSYYSGWFEPFSASFAKAAAQHGALPLVQLNPRGVTMTAIASGQYDDYLTSYASAVRAYRSPVVLSFGHEMNGDWYPWGFRHTSPTVFVAAWRHIVKIFRAAGARNVIWMWTVNSVYTKHDMIPDPAAWWPGSSYVNWVGIDGYFHQASSQFASVFGATIIDVRELTKDPILISETGAGPDTGQAAKIASLFAGVRSYQLLGFLWFDAVGNGDDRIVSRASIAALRLGAKTSGLG